MKLIIEIDDDIAKGIRGENDCNVEPREIVRSFQATISEAIANGTPVSNKGDLISREYVEKIISLEVVDLQDGTEEWRTYVNDTCENIMNKVHNAPTINPDRELIIQNKELWKHNELLRKEVIKKQLL